MFYRRKILLALIEACGRNLSSTDTEKLLFMYCAERGVNFYDFFPYRFGSFSFLSYQDKRVLTKQGYLADAEGFKLDSRRSFFADLQVEDKLHLRDFALRTKNLRGEALVRYVYLKYPYYASRSEIKNRVLTSRERAMVNSCLPKGTGLCLFTIGYEGLTIDAYINKLIQHRVAVVVDLRRNPISMKYGFSKTRLRNYLERVGIGYEHIPELGIASSLRKNLETEKDYNSLFRKYALIALPHCEGELKKIREFLSIHKRVALTCFEHKPSSCHRHKITERLEAAKNWDIPIVHV